MRLGDSGRRATVGDEVATVRGSEQRAMVGDEETAARARDGHRGWGELGIWRVLGLGVRAYPVMCGRSENKFFCRFMLVKDIQQFRRLTKHDKEFYFANGYLQHCQGNSVFFLVAL